MNIDDLFGDGRPPTEPRSDFKQAANGLWEMYQALVQSGFTEEQALKLVMASLGWAGKGE